ncbi:hypothetical protein [Paracraurococcus ruber]|nr:hypothetical protein [Paracraurococcus ruber]
MIGKVGLDGLVSALPVAGAGGEVLLRASRKLLRTHLARPT